MADNNTSHTAQYQIQFKAFSQSDWYTIEEAKNVAELADKLIAEGSASYFAKRDGKHVGHVCYTRVIIEGHEYLNAYILGPLAVLPEYQKQRVASQLLKDAEEQLGADVILVVGDKDHYSSRYNTPHKLTIGLDIPEEVSRTALWVKGTPNLCGKILIKGEWADMRYWQPPSQMPED